MGRGQAWQGRERGAFVLGMLRWGGMLSREQDAAEEKGC